MFRQTKDRPTFLILGCHIGYGSLHKQDTPEAHGEPLGDDEVRLAKRSYGWPEDAKPFPGWLRCGPATPMRSLRPIDTSRGYAISPPSLRSRASLCQLWIEAGTLQHPASRVVPISWLMLQTEILK